MSSSTPKFPCNRNAQSGSAFARFGWDLFIFHSAAEQCIGVISCGTPSVVAVASGGVTVSDVTPPPAREIINQTHAKLFAAPSGSGSPGSAGVFSAFA